QHDWPDPANLHGGAKDLFGVGHLRNPFRAGEGGDLDPRNAGRRETADQFDLLRGPQHHLFILDTVARRNIAENNLVGLTLVHRLRLLRPDCYRQPEAAAIIAQSRARSRPNSPRICTWLPLKSDATRRAPFHPTPAE